MSASNFAEREYRAFIRAVADPHLTPQRLAVGVRAHARALLNRHSSPPGDVVEAPSFRPARPEVTADLQCSGCLHVTSYPQLLTQIRNPGRCGRCGGTLHPRVKAPV